MNRIDPKGLDSSDVMAGYAIGVFNGFGMMLNAAFNAKDCHENPMEKVEVKAEPGVWSNDGLEDADFRAGLELGKVVGTIGFFALARTGKRAPRSKAFDDLPSVRPRSRDALIPVRTQKLGKKGFGDVVENEPYLYVVSEAGEVLISPRGAAGRGGVKHTQLSPGQAVKAAGEMVFEGANRVKVNSQSGRYRAQAPEAVERVAQELSKRGLDTTIEVDAF